jgi:hypothetical protein
LAITDPGGSTTMSDETRNPQDEVENERRPSHLTDDEPEVEGHRMVGRMAGRDEDEGEDGEGRIVRRIIR